MAFITVFTGCSSEFLECSTGRLLVLNRHDDKVTFLALFALKNERTVMVPVVGYLDFYVSVLCSVRERVNYSWREMENKTG